MSSRVPRHTQTGVVSAGETTTEYAGGSTLFVKASNVQEGSHAKNRGGQMKGRGKSRGNRVFIVGVDAPRWGKSSMETIKRRSEWGQRVGETEPIPLRKCSDCGGWASRSCRHGSNSGS